MKFLLSLFVLLSISPSFAEAARKHKCAAILLMEGVESEICQEKNEALHALPVALFNFLVCSDKSRFRTGEHSFERDPDSGNLFSGAGSILCHWEVRANSGGAK